MQRINICVSDIRVQCTNHSIKFPMKMLLHIDSITFGSAKGKVKGGVGREGEGRGGEGMGGEGREGEGRGGEGREGEGRGGEGREKRLAIHFLLCHMTHTLTIAILAMGICCATLILVPILLAPQLDDGPHEQSHRRLLCRKGPQRRTFESCSLN